MRALLLATCALFALATVAEMLLRDEASLRVTMGSEPGSGLARKSRAPPSRPRGIRTRRHTSSTISR